MPLDVEVPDPPSLRGPQSRGEYAAIDMTDRELGDDYRREEIEAILGEGAWRDAFEEWSEHTDLSEEEFGTVEALGLIEGFDFYWDPATDDVGYLAPAIPDGERGGIDEEDAEVIEEELDALGRVVSETLENDYLPRDDEAFGFFSEEYTGGPSETE